VTRMGNKPRKGTPMHLRRNSILTFAGVALIALGLAACGSSNNSSTTNASTGSATPASSGGATVSTMSVGSIGNALVDSNGAVLYTNNKDTGSKVACTGSCAGIWVPLAAPSSGQPTSGDASVQAKLGVVKTPDGASQVTYEGKPLYTFVQDSPGQATGNGVTDSFNGTSFTWTVASGGAKSAGSTSSTSSGNAGSSGTSSSGGGGGYGY
jgi:predicted lipoprotein with Yx(FWY)xxD motif